MHSHILPGIDDGSPDVETSVELVKGLMALGLKRSIATPHIISDMYRNTAETIGAAQAKLRKALQDEGIDYTVDAAAEYMMDAAFFEKLEQGERLLRIKDNIILTEFSWAAMPNNPKLMSFSILTAGYTPILAHPERYNYFHNNTKVYYLMKELGFLLQVNLSSLTGYYGPGAAKAAKYIIKNNLCSFVGTDLHNVRHLQLLQDGRGVFEELLKGREMMNEGL
ncbi:MAG: capsular biosynthesis protein [Sphingobacteriales bacterium]|nr:MAG: capsular biosynthesis protein [Sphingobacteriales bacterium]